jgi:hypothetical protein
MKKFLKILLSVLIIIPVLYFTYIEYVKINKNITTNNENYSSLRRHHDRLLINTKNKNISQSDDILNLEKKFANLEKKFSNLRRELSQLESKLPKKTSDGNYRVKWLNLSNWRQIKEEMSERQVLNILGEPTARNIDAYGTNLYYNGFGKSGYVKVGKFGLGVMEYREPNF